MFARVILTLTVFLGLALNVQAHAIISPALGVKGAPVRNDVQRPSKAQECGNVNIAKTLDSTTPIVAQGETFVATITNFNGGVDGSRAVKTALVDATGTGSKFVSATVTKNGDQSPSAVGSQQLSVQLPAGTKCSGGPNKDLCLVSLTTDGGFGNCVVVQQGGAAAKSGAAAGKKPKRMAARAWGSRIAREPSDDSVSVE